MTARTAGQSGAEAEASGTIAINATWSEDIYFRTPDGAAMDLTGLEFEFQFRTSPNADSAVKTLSTSGGELTIETDDGAVDSILRISVDPGAFASYPGDLVADLVAIDGDENVTLYAHGVISFTNNPVSV
jgi:hypothetical protein